MGPGALPQGSGLSTNLDYGLSGVVIGVAGDSTGNDANEWVARMASTFASRYPERRVEYALWSDTTQNYPSTTLLHEGDGVSSLKIYNGSMPGSTLSYHRGRVPTLFPERLDLLIVSTGHNYRAQTAEPYLAEIHAFVADVRALYPGVEVVVSSQNPSFSDGLWPAANVAAHADRLAALRSSALAAGYGYIPVYEAFAGKPDGGRAWVMGDGIHPLHDPSGEHDGSVLWVEQVNAYFAALSYRY